MEDNFKTFTVAKIRYPPYLNLQACYPVIKKNIALIWQSYILDEFVLAAVHLKYLPGY